VSGSVASSAGLCVDAASVRDPIAGPVLTAVLTAVAHVYEETEGIALPCAWGMFAGAAAAVDRGADCGTDPETGRECRGLVWVRLVNVFPSIAFPDPYVQSYRDDLSYAVLVEVGVARPAPKVTEADGEQYFPSMEEETDTAALLVTDLAIIRHALVTVYAGDGDIGLVLGVVTPFGPEGNVVGATTLATVQVE
jgi:hypothetical protein